MRMSNKSTAYDRAYITPYPWHLGQVQPNGWTSNTLGILIAIAKGG